MAERDFKGVWIPRQVWLDKNLTMLDKGILTEIDSLDIGEDGCWASNEYLAKFCGCSECKVSLAVSKLAQMGYIKVESFDGRRRKIKSCLLDFKTQPFKKSKADFEKSKESNIHINPLNKPNNTNGASALQGFDSFWSIYPRKTAKQEAIKRWKGLKPNAGLVDTILADVRKKMDTEWKDQPMQFIPHPATYLNQRRWEDETVITRQAERKEPQTNPALDYSQREYKDDDFQDYFLDLDNLDNYTV